MQTLTGIPGYDRLYQRFYPPPPTPVAPQVTVQPRATVSIPNGNFTTAEMLVTIVCLGIVAYGCYHVYQSHQQLKKATRQNMYYSFP